jgi:bleomycin hydrolase
MKKIFLIACISLGFQAVAQDNLVDALKGNKSDSAKKFVFTNQVYLENSEVKNQGSSGTCWSYSSNSFMESEMLRMGKKYVDISEIYTARCAYIERAINYVRMHGAPEWGDGAELHDALLVLKKYGAMPQEAYSGLNYGTTKNKFGEMQAGLEGFLKGIVENKNGKLTKNWLPAFTAAMDSYLGKVPEDFMYQGKKYTPLTFAKEVVGINADDYVNIGSFNYEPYYKQVFLPVPDNWSFQTLLNVPMNDLSRITNYSLSKGYSVAWATDVSEKYFSWKNGVAVVPVKEFEDMEEDEKKQIFAGPQPERKITEEVRADGFNNYTTTDDHGMHIVGTANDQDGKTYFIVKNSWGDKNDYKGYLQASMAFFNYKTIAIVVNKNALPADILAKLK